MLMQNFKSAADLGITDEEHRALVRVLGMFEREEIPKEKFHMSMVSCGTQACIMGWCQWVAGDHLFSSKISDIMNKPALYQELFMFGSARRFYEDDPQHAATALRSYLTTGDARWDLAVAS